MNRPEPAINFSINGDEIAVPSDRGRRLSEVLRETLGLRGTKVGCDAGDCGACTVLIDGAPVCACLTPMAQVAGRDVVTVEGLSKSGLDRLQQSFLRHGAAQCGICTPGMLMAATALLNENPDPTRAEVEEALSGVLCRCTGYTKIIDAVVDMDRTALPQPAAGASVGARIERLDGVKKVSGAEVYGADLMPDNALLVRAIRSPHHRATFELKDVAEWAKQHGIEVFTAVDIPGDNRFGTIPAFVDQPSLAQHHVRMRGEAVALVAGEPSVIEALDLSAFPIVWTPEPPELDQIQARTSANLLHEARLGNELIAGRVQRGDPGTALANSAYAATLTINTSYVEHAYIEPEAGAAWMEGETLVIQACTQAPAMDRDETARVLGLPRERVRIIPSATGGGFGSKLDLSLQPLIGLVTLKTGRPSRMIYTRAESMMSTTKRHPARMTSTIGCDTEGRITGMVFDGDFNTGAYASWGPTVAIRVPVHASGPYFTLHYHAEARAIHTNGPVSGAFRGFGVPQAAIVQEMLYDELATVVGIDRLKFRHLNALRDGQATVCGQELAGVGIAECLTALENPWRDALERAATANGKGSVLRHGVGIASCWYGCGNTGLPNPSTIRVGIAADGRLKLHQGATDIGQGSNTVVTQFCADALGLPVDAFDLIGPDTALTPDCGKTSASRQTYVTGKAALLAGQSLRKQILQMTNMGETAAFAIEGARLRVSQGTQSRTIELESLAPDQNGYVLSAQETYDPPTSPLDENGQGTPYAVYGYGAQIAEVTVDTELGTVKVTRVTAAHDLGRVVNPMLAEGQVEGGVAQGLGMALMEEYIPGRTENLHDYLIPTTGDMPEIRSIFIECADPEGPMGAKGLGEHVLIPTAPAILNAIRHATGARIDRLPALPHRVLKAIRDAN